MSKHLPADPETRGRLRLLGVDGDHDALGAVATGGIGDQLRVLDRSGVDRNLVGPRVEQAPHVLHLAYAAAHREGNEHLRRDLFDDVQDQFALVRARGDVEERQLVRALLVVAPRDLDRIACVAQAYEFDAFDDAPAVDVETRNNPLGEHGRDRGSGKITASRGNVLPRSSVLRFQPLALRQFVRFGLGLLEIERALINRATGNDAVDALGFDFAQRPDVLDVREAAARDHRNAQLPRELQRRVDVHSRQHAVAADIGVDDRLDAIVLEFLREVHHVVTGHLGPALDGDFAVFGVERDDDVP